MKDKKKLILKRIKEIYHEYQTEGNNPNATRYAVSDLDMLEYALKVLVDIYTFDNKKDEEHRYIYQDWDLVEFVITDVLEKE